MNNSESKDIRRFFDLLGSIVCALAYSFSVWRVFFRFTPLERDKIYFLPLFLLLGLAVYLAFYSLIWKALGTKFLRGYANFIFISVSSVTAGFLLAYVLGMILYGLPEQSGKNLTAGFFSVDTLYFYYLTLLPMAFFWLLGVLCGWKFAKRTILP